MGNSDSLYELYEYKRGLPVVVFYKEKLKYYFLGRKGNLGIQKIGENRILL
jgi:hypothetical protein